MKIQYLGHSAFLLELGGVRIVTDPYGDVGFPMPHVRADAVTVSHSHYDHCNVGAVETSRVLQAAGEYRIGDVRIVAKEYSHDDAGGKKRGKTLVFRFEAEGLSLVHFGDIGEPATHRMKEEIGGMDVMLLPVGGHYTIDAAEAKRYTELFRPSFVIPMHYLQPALTVDIAGAEQFLKLFGGNVERVGTSFSVVSAEPGGTRVVFMERRK